MTTPNNVGFRRRPRIALLCAMSALVAISVAACSSSARGSSSGSDKAASVSSVTLSIGDQKGTGAQALLQAAGMLGKLPFHVRWSDFTSGPPMLQAMGAGAVDIGGVGDAPPVFAAAGNEKIVFVGARTTGPQAAALVVRAGSPIASISQLRGRKIAVAQGSSAEYHLLTVLRKAGLTTRDVTLENLQPAEALAALSSGHIDAWDTWSPYVEQVVSQNHARVLANGAGYGSNYSFEIASRAALDDPAKAAAIRDYLTVLDQAYRWSASHLSTWATLWAEATGLPIGVMSQASKDDLNTPVTITGDAVTAEQRLADAFYSAGLIPDSVNVKDYTTTQFNGTVKGAS